jgi:acyl-CoA thioester hydrolase
MVNETTLRVRYSETDQMGVVYYANYLVWMEVGRTNLIRECGITYKELESKGYILPVVYVVGKYLKPSYYDDEIIVQSALMETTLSKIRIGYKIYRVSENGRELVFVGLTDLVFMDAKSGKVVRMPEFFREAVKISETEEYKSFVEDVKKTLKV